MSAIPKTRAIFLNGRPHAIGGAATLITLLRELGLADRRGVAAAVNGEVVPRAEWAARELAERDRVLVIRATQGG